MHSQCVRAAANLATFSWILASVAPAQTPFTLQRIGSEVGAFTAVASVQGDKSRLFALTRDGRVIVVSNGTLQATPFLDIRPLVVATFESGALGLAFDPDYLNNGYFYIAHMTQTAGEPPYSVVRYRAPLPTGATADPASRTIIMPLAANNASIANHNGGWIGFGPDGYLYISRGEGPVFGTTAQDPATIYGKILRIDVHGDDFPADPQRNYSIPPGNPFAGAVPGADEVWMMGLRNPYRCSFDRETHDFWIADVGSAAWEEIDVIRAANWPTGALNFGWPCLEAARVNNTTGLCANPTGLTPPNAAYPRSGAFSASCILGGYVYRGCAIADFRGQYIFTPSCGSTRLASVSALHPEEMPVVHINSGSTLTGVYGFGEDGYGELYICGTSGLFKLLPAAGQYADCNHNGIPDACEIADGSVLDENHDGVPDSCTRLCRADVDASGTLNVGDVFWFLNVWFGGAAGGDFNLDAAITLQDMFDFLEAFFEGC